jgi:hypothetical protein
VLEGDLRRHGAPAALVAHARQAQRDEARHFLIMHRLAVAAGAPPLRFPRPAAVPPRSLAQVALENATEGCVGETFSAAVNLWQASTARDTAVRAALAGIAADELDHAQLAWSVDSWAQGGLDAETRRQIAEARAQAGRALIRGSGEPVEPTLVREAGLPEADAAARLARSAYATLWA